VGSALAIALACALGADARLDAGVGTQATTRRTDALGQAPAIETDVRINVALTPRLHLAAQGGGIAFRAGYQPQVTFVDVGRSVQRNVMHDASLALGVAPSSVWSLTATATGGMGRTDLVTENLRPSLPAGTIPDSIATRQVLEVERAGMSLALRSAPTRRSTVELGAGASVGGGTDRASRVYLPMERSANAAAGYRYAVTREDRVGLDVSGQVSRLEQAADAAGPQTTSAFGVAIATWRHQLTPSVETRSGAGAMWLYSDLPAKDGAAERRTRARPAAELGLDMKSLTRDVNGEAVARLWADIDRITGEVSQQLQGSATLGWAMRPSLKLSASAGAALAWQDSGASRRGELTLRTSWAATRLVGTELGAYGAWQHSPSAPSFTEIGAFVALTFEMAPVDWRASE
jgi:hypothetical protein